MMTGISVLQSNKQAIDLTVVPNSAITSTIIGKPMSEQRGAVIEGFRQYTYQLPHGDSLSFIANQHQSQSLQIIFSTHNADLIQQLPSSKANSLVLSTINQLKAYSYRSKQYGSNKIPEQLAKESIALNTIKKLSTLLGRERSLKAADIKGQEQLRVDVIKLIEEARKKNRHVCDSLLVSEGYFNQIFYTTAYEHVEEFQFNQAIEISKHDQLNFTNNASNSLSIENPIIVQLLIDFDLTTTDIRRINDYFSNEKPLTQYNESAIKNLINSIESLKNNSSELIKELKLNYKKIKQSHHIKALGSSEKMIVWDSEYHVDNSSEEINKLMLSICDAYQIDKPSSLKEIQANRFSHLSHFFKNLWQQAQEYVDYLANKHKPTQTLIDVENDDFTFSTVDSFYQFKGRDQSQFDSFESLIDSLYHADFHDQAKHYEIQNPSQARELRHKDDDTQIITVTAKNFFFIKHEGKYTKHRYFKEHDNYSILPTGNDLIKIANINNSPVNVINRITLNFRAFVSRFFHFFRNEATRFYRFIRKELPQQLLSYYYDGHIDNPALRQSLGVIDRETANQINLAISQIDFNPWLEQGDDEQINTEQFVTQMQLSLQQIITHHIAKNTHISQDELKLASGPLVLQLADKREALLKQKELALTIKKILRNKQLLPNGLTIEQFINQHMDDNNTIAAIAEHPANNFEYNNPFHHIYRFVWHIGKFFVNYSERNPIIGTLATAAYLYGAAAILCPTLLNAMLVKLHLYLLAKGIPFTQALAQLMSHGTTSEAITAAMTYWQGAIALSQADRILETVISSVKDNPAELAAISTFVIGLGYVMCQAFPVFGNEMGPYPYINYATLGAKGSATLYDMAIHPGHDIILGSIKWFISQLAFIAYCLLGPLLEWSQFGFYNGFVLSWKKNLATAFIKLKQLIAATAHLFVSIGLFIVSACVSLLVHVPFKGITKLITITCSSLLNLKSIGQSLINCATTEDSWNYFKSFRLSPLYFFSNPIQKRSDNRMLNVALNIASVILLPIFEIIKNFIILPALDCISLSFRLFMTVLINPVFRFTCLLAGITLYLVGLLSRSFLKPVEKFNHTVIKTTDTIEDKYIDIRLKIFSFLNTILLKLQLWAFNEEINKPQEKPCAWKSLTNAEKFNPSRKSIIGNFFQQCDIESPLHQALEEKSESSTSHPLLFFPEKITSDKSFANDKKHIVINKP